MTPKRAVTASNMIMILKPSGLDLMIRALHSQKDFGRRPLFEGGLVIFCNMPLAWTVVRGGQPVLFRRIADFSTQPRIRRCAPLEQQNSSEFCIFNRQS